MEALSPDGYQDQNIGNGYNGWCCMIVTQSLLRYHYQQQLSLLISPMSTLGREMLLRAHLREGIYYVDSVSTHLKQNIALVARQSESLCLWHHQFEGACHRNTNVQLQEL